ncbi:iron complex outermembrane receptor protein [Novosphingobium kunmingense]|uniref:Iron complex outermembrane receptor protein n=1 Tax=Novosphingobium kunmingense TaxID=1211806 RepID=A0A2N0H3G2_9SPHN|nr:TonB-dependent receptor [Novosphingobium kunmingense]PKB13467.1 iron complex outermembrane receptor protein [Novosphingobium kunmingense]
MRATYWMVSASIAGLVIATPALAQDGTSGAATPTDGDEGAIIVTARRQNERLQDVPASVAVLTSAALERTGATRAEDFVQLTPGVTIVTGTAEAGDTQINIRGMNGARDAESSVALVVDGILKTNTAQLNQDQGTLRQVEILKGPQGAIYGRNAAAGAIVVQTLKPTDMLSGGVKASYGEHDTWGGSAYLAGPLMPGSGFVLSGSYDRSDGFYKNAFLDDASVVDDYRRWSVDGRVILGMNSDTMLDLKARYGEHHGASLPFNAAFALPLFAGVNPAFYEDVNRHPFNFYSNVRPTNDQTSFDVSAKLEHDFGGMKLTAWALFSDIKQDLVADGTSADFARYISAANPAAQSSVDACFASTAALTGYPVNQPGFIGAIPVPFIFAPASGSTFGPYSPTTCDGIQYQLRNQKDISGEVRLASSGNGPFNWQLGAYYLHIDRTVGVSLGADEGQGVIKQLYNAPDTVNPTSLLLADDFNTNVYAAFGSVDWKPVEQFSVGLALRYDSEHRTSSSLVPTASDPFTGGPINPGQAFGPLVPQSGTYDQLQPKVSLSWRPSNTFNLYAAWGIGFKSGGFNNQGSAALINQNFNDGVTLGTINAGVSVQDQYRKEKSSAFEVGMKGSVFEDRLTFDLAGYYTRVTDMQFFEFFVGGFGLLRVVSNIDQVDIKGAELNLGLKVIDGWRFFASGNLTDSEIKKNASRPYTIGNKSPYTADYTINLGTEITAPLSEATKLLVRADYRVTGPTWFSTVQCQTRPSLFSGLLPISALALPGFVGDANYCQSRREAFGVLNLRAGIQTDRFSIAAFANNMMDRKYLAEVIPAIEFGGSFISPGARRLFGVEASAKF